MYIPYLAASFDLNFKATALCPYIGYQKAADIAKTALKTNRTVRELVLEQKLMTASELNHVLDPYAMTEISDSMKKAM